jgi:hypothetical protein
MQIGLMFLWIIFFLIFLYLAIWHLHQSRQMTPHIKVNARPMDRPGSGIKGSVIIKGSDLDQPNRESVVEFNKYVDAQNASSRKAHRITAFGYGLAAATSLISAVVVL